MQLDKGKIEGLSANANTINITFALCTIITKTIDTACFHKVDRTVNWEIP